MTRVLPCRRARWANWGVRPWPRRAALVFRAYLKNPEANAQALAHAAQGGRDGKIILTAEHPHA